MAEIESLIHAVPDFPTSGILFRDITPLLLDAERFEEVIDRFTAEFAGRAIDKVVAIESRGFVFGAPLALRLGCGFAPVRKVGKLPRSTRSREYALEYGTNHLEMHVDAVHTGDRVLVVDDVLATGGTARATVEIVEELGGEVVAAAFLLELKGLPGRSMLKDTEVFCLLAY